MEIIYPAYVPVTFEPTNDVVTLYTDKEGDEVILCFFCKGCGYRHPVHIASKEHEIWEWNVSRENPTFSPSVGVNMDEPSRRCHSYIVNGHIQYLSDCFHSLAGKTIPLEPETPEQASLI